MDWGSVPDWIAGVGSVLAFVAFGIAFLWEVRKRRIDERRSALNSERAQAAEVSCWLSRPTPSNLYSTVVSVFRKATIHVTNSSKLPVYDASVLLWAPIIVTEPILWQRYTVLPPVAEPLVISSEESDDAEGVRILRYATGVSIRFRDSQGTWWYRSRDGRLHRLTSSTWREAFDVESPGQEIDVLAREDVSVTPPA